MKRAIIIHGWDGYPEEAWFPWLKSQLEKEGVQVKVPQMPESGAPNMYTWVPALANIVGKPDEELYLIGHSIGVQTILRYLEAIDSPIGGVLAVSGFFTLIPGSIGGPEEEAIAEPWLTKPINTEKVRQDTGKIISIFSDNDPYVDLENVTMFEERLGSKTVVLKGRGHIGGNDNAEQVPEILGAFHELLKRR